MADMQFDILVVMRRIRDREGSPAAVGEEEIQILAGAKLQALAFRQFQSQAHHIMGQMIGRVYAAGQQLYLDVGGGLCLACRNGQIAGRKTLAGQALTGPSFLQGGRGTVVYDLAGEQVGGTGSTSPVAASVGEADVLANGRLQNGLVFFDLETMAAGADGNGKTHEFLVLC